MLAFTKVVPGALESLAPQKESSGEQDSIGRSEIIVFVVLIGLVTLSFGVRLWRFVPGLIS